MREGQALAHVDRVEVNLSGRSLDDAGLPAYIEARLAELGVEPSRLVLEVTETAAIANMEDAARFAARLREAGCAFALDDFGTGFGSFYYLKHLPLDYLKLDGDFIRDLPNAPTDQVMVRAMVEVAAALGLRTIAECVQDEQTIALLQEYGVDLAQGWHVGRPRPLRPDGTRTGAELRGSAAARGARGR
jgi:EAL domain-containing protein (putative c-di-GMP-specific phosphodiesterase class I)